jgi:flagellin-like hook-associated protein FlgL
MSDITLSAAVRQNLLSLQGTADMMSQTNNRLATGNKVNSAVDNPNSYFTAQGLNNRASDLSTLQDAMGLAVQTVNAASQGIDGISKLVAQAKSVANQALQTTVTATTDSEAFTAHNFSGASKTLVIKVGSNASTSITLSTDIASAGALKAALSGKVSGLTIAKSGTGVKFSVASGDSLTISGTALGTVIGTSGSAITSSNGTNRNKFVAQYNDLLTQIDQMAGDASFNGVNLLKSGTTLTVNFNEKQTSKLDITGVDMSSTGLSLSSQTDWSSDATIKSVTGKLDSATTTLRTQSSTFGSNLAVVQNRQDFTKNLINTLQTGASGLTLADTNLEGANLLALQTRQSLATTALSLSNQAQQSITRILG